MSKQSEAVKKWRNATKSRIVSAFGGSCCICSYNKCNGALALHHLDPSQKDFNFGRFRANPKSWVKLCEEFRKCVLVCHNCHNEVHNGVATVPVDAPRFDESFSNYKENIRKELTNSKQATYTPCAYCSTPKPLNQKFCSCACSSKARFRVDWDALNLLELLKTRSFISVAEELGVSDAAVHKRYKKLIKNAL
jgi:hypothetical protein